MNYSYFRTPAVEIILDELINDSDVLSSFLKVLSCFTYRPYFCIVQLLYFSSQAS